MRYGDALAWVVAPTEAEAVRRSLELHPLGDWTDDAREPVVFPQDACRESSGPHDCIRAVLSPSSRVRRGVRALRGHLLWTHFGLRHRTYRRRQSGP